MRGDDLHNRVRTKLALIDTSYDGKPQGVSAYGEYHRQAAVLSSFDPAELRHSGTEAYDDELYSVLADSVFSDSDGSWSLDEAVRRNVLNELASPQAILDVLERTPSRPESPAQGLFERYLKQNAPPIREQSLDELVATLQVASWLPPSVARHVGLPDREIIQAYIDRTDLLQPFRWLAGKHFSGRAQELRELREYVGIRPPSSGIHAISRGVREIVNLHKEPPLLIHGPGGIGKSTLVARFVLDHVDLGSEDRFPFVYIDFDRPGMLPEKPATLILEAVRQLGVRYPESRAHADSVREAWHQRLQRSASDKMSSDHVVKSFAEDFRRFLWSMSFGEKPLLFVLDTFEEVQSRGDGFVREVGDFLGLLQGIWPRLRTVISSRAPVSAFSFRPRQLALGDLDEEAARGFLQGRDVDAETARKLSRRLGGNPLTLGLAAELLRREKSSALRGIETHKFFFVRLQSAQIQGQLFRRILWHVGKGNPELRKLAHPGLVLRRLTPEIILQVLAEPCGLALAAGEEAERLFRDLRLEVSLLEPDGAGGLRHRPDVRRVMLRLIEADEPDTVRDIHRRAVAYYEQKQNDLLPGTDPRLYRVEELYHRLALGDDTATLDDRWIPGIERDLAGAMEEFRARERAYLASRLGLTLDRSVRAVADLQTWERSTEALVRSLLDLGQVEEAHEELTVRGDRSSDSPLHVLDVTVLERLGRTDAAVAAADRAIDLASESGVASLIMELLLVRTRLASTQKDQESARRFGGEACQLAEAISEDLLLLRANLACGRYVAPLGRSVAEDQACLFMELDEELLKRHVDVVVDAAAQLGAIQPSLLVRAVRIAGLEAEDGAARRRLARVLLAWDEQYSAQMGEAPGRLAHEAGLEAGESPADSWRRVLESSSATLLNGTVAALLERPILPKAVVDALTEIFAQRAERRDRVQRGERPSAEADATRDFTVSENRTLAAGAPASAPLRLSEVSSWLLRDAIISSFTLEELNRILNVRLSRSLHTISLHKDDQDVVSDLVRVAETEGWLAQLVAGLIESRPHAAPLQKFSQAIGLAPVMIDDAGLRHLLDKVDSTLEHGEWRRRLGILEAQVCRIEKSDGNGTGFLIGPHHLLTSRSLMEGVIRQTVDSRSVMLRFDHKSIRVSQRDFVVSDGVLYRLAARWLVREYSDAVVLEVEGSPGDQPVGWVNLSFEEMAPTRGWIRASRRPPPLEGRRSVLVLGCGEGPLSLVYSAYANVALAGTGERFTYDLMMHPGATGAPCFDENLELLGLHLSYDPDERRSEGVPIDRVTGGNYDYFEEAAVL